MAFHEQNGTARSNDLGQWSLYLASESAGGPYQLTVRSKNTITISDILVGDVWLASGQSNMEMPLKGIPTAVVKDGAQGHQLRHAPSNALAPRPNQSFSLSAE